MKRFILIFLLFLSVGLLSFAENKILKQANDFYAAGDFANAAIQYEKVLVENGNAPELYYNLGNAYYRTNEIGRSILNYERALRLSPLFEDAKVNLQFANLKVVDNIVQTPSFFLSRWMSGLIKLLTSNQWFIISFIVFIITLICSLIFIFGTTKQLRKNSFYVGSILLVVAILTISFSGIRKSQMESHNEAIVISGLVVAKSTPDNSGTDLFQIHEGTKVLIKSSLGKWIEIELGNGNIGWVEQLNIERI